MGNLQTNTIPPGELLLQELQKIGMSQKELATRVGRPLKTVNEIIKGKNPITVATAMQLEKIFKLIPSSKWLELENDYRHQLAILEEKDQLKRDLDWIANFPLKEMKKLGWIDSSKKGVDTVKSLLTFFGVASVKQWKDIYLKEISSSSFRISATISKEASAITAWLRQGEIDSMKRDLDKEYDKNKFKKVLLEVKLLSYRHPEDFAEQLVKLCEKAGVAIIYTPRLPKAPINGAARWIYDKPVIQLTDYGKRNDRFWFTFFHEAGHILLHGKKEKHKNYDTKQEEYEVDEFANKWLVNDNIFDEIISYEDGDISHDVILKISGKYQLHPGIIVGHLQYKGVIGFHEFTCHIKRIDLFK